MAKAKVCIVDHDYKADYKVFFADHPRKEKNAQIIKGGKLVDHDYQADVNVFLVDQEDKADIIITRKKFPN